MTIKYSPQHWPNGQQHHQETSFPHHFCFCCVLSVVLGTLFAAFTAFHFNEQISSWIVTLTQPPLDARPIEVVMSKYNPVIDLCIYDYGCDDGDRIKVTLNGGDVFRGELYAERQCLTDLDVRLGGNSIVLTALNGSGGKGGCPNEVNTGAVLVASVDENSWQEYSWALSEGESAEALIVTKRPR